MKFLKAICMCWYALILLLALPVSVSALEVQDVTISAHSGGERIEVKLSEAGDYRPFLLENPPRLVLDLPPFSWEVASRKLQKYKGALISNIRYARFDAVTSRVVFDLTKPVELLDKTLGSRENPPADLILQIHQVEPSVATVVQSPAPIVSPPLARLPMNVPMRGVSDVSMVLSGASVQVVGSDYSGQGASFSTVPLPVRKPSPLKSWKRPLIVIDAGHGGKDSGALGKNRTKEKHITLKYAAALKKALKKTGKYRVALTREDDRFILLRDRVKIARKMDGDLFLSLHADSAPTVKARGLSIYTLSEKSSDAEAAALAEQENKADVLHGFDLTTQDEDVAGILIDLAQRDTKNKSIQLAETIVEALTGRLKLLPNTHRFAGFAVLKAPDIPSALIEIGFLSNPQEERHIQTEAHREKVVNGIVRGVEKYFAEVEE